jgi:hypothetical protein
MTVCGVLTKSYLIFLFCLQLLKTLPVLQAQLDALLEFDVSNFFFGICLH